MTMVVMAVVVVVLLPLIPVVIARLKYGDDFCDIDMLAVMAAVSVIVTR